MDFPILLCDDSQLAQRMLIKALPSDWPVRTHLANNGRKALKLLKAQHMAVTFIDLVMPEMDGWQLMQQIRQAGIETLIIVVTGDRQQQTRQRALQAGACAVLTKPLQANELSTLLKNYGLYVPAPIKLGQSVG